MAKTHGERIASLETVHEEIIKPMRQDIRDIKTNVQSMSLEMPELLRKVNEHHGFVKDLKKEGCPRPKSNLIKDNSNHDKRWLDQKKYKIMIWGLIITISGLLLSNMAMCAWVSNNFNEIIQSMPK